MAGVTSFLVGLAARSASGSSILIETDGDEILSETGDKLLLE